jgi:transcriptional regulator with XRE-family HTH domain
MRRVLHSPEYEFLREQLTRGREKASLSQNEVAELLARTQSFVSKYEKGERRLDVVDFVRVCKVLKIDASKLLDQVQKLVR